MPNAWEARPNRYTKAIIEKEAAKAKAYSCEALYLDPGWDTEFGTFLWGEQWLGPRTAFVRGLAQLESDRGESLRQHLARIVDLLAFIGKELVNRCDKPN